MEEEKVMAGEIATASNAPQGRRPAHCVPDPDEDWLEELSTVSDLVDL